MALHEPTHETAFAGLGRILLVAAIAIAVLIAVTAIVGVQVAGPSLDITSDPAGMTLPF
jgi:hypothetical protein